jgi:penicillin amidase
MKDRALFSTLPGLAGRLGGAILPGGGRRRRGVPRSPATVLTRRTLRAMLGRRLPVTDGTLKVPWLREAIRIRRDALGVPYIDAPDFEHAWFGVGFCMGQDRTFQLEFFARAVRGTLAELVGPDGVAMDRLTRRLGLLHSAREQRKNLAPDVHTDLDAFVAGINAGIRSGRRRRPHELALLRGEPGVFRATDSIAIVKLLSFAMGSNWDSELARLQILAQDGPEALRALDPTAAADLGEAAIPDASTAPALDRLAADLDHFGQTLGIGGGSNNFAVSGARTASGRPLLANDPHLGPALPNNWYLCHVTTPEERVSGAQFAGAPGFIFGYNGHAAWGVTAGHADNTDLFLETLSDDGRSVRQGGEWVPCDVRREVIKVRGKAPVVEEVLVTPRGPIITPALEGSHEALSLSATWLGTGPARGVLHLHRARTLEDVRWCMADWPGMTVNLLFVTDASLAWHFLGQVPRRRKGHGLLPAPGSDPEAGWEEGVIPVAELPHRVDPEDGVLATANADPDPEGRFPYLGGDWFDGYRTERARGRLRERDDWTLASMAQLQLDEVSLPWRELRETVLALAPKTRRAKRGYDLLARWDGVVAEDSAAATVFELFLAEMIRRAVQSKAPRSAQWALGRGFMELAPNSSLALRRVGHIVRLLRDQPGGWFAGGWASECLDALESAVARLERDHGQRSRGWRWGKLRTLTLEHPVGKAPGLGALFNIGPIEIGGDTNTLQCASVDPSRPLGNPVGVATMRMVVEVGNWSNNRWALAGGQSGNPLSPHYDDMIPLWKRAEGAPIAWTDEEIARVARHDLQLLPRAGEDA